MKHARSISKSQLFAAGITFTAIALLLAPLRPGPSDMQTQHASFIPILAANGVAETGAFRRLASVRPATASATPQLRVSRSRVAATVRPQVSEAPLAHDFSRPRVSWEHLSGDLRGAIDAAIKSGASWRTVVIHGSSISSAGRLDRLHRLIRGAQEGHPYHFILDGGQISYQSDGATSDVLHVCFIGDFHAAPPSEPGLSAFDELLDYLTIKLGALEVRSHSQSCVGAAFPADKIIRAVGNGG